jgi:hypothetical protein
MKARLNLMRALAPARRVCFLCSSKENRRKEKTPEGLVVKTPEFTRPLRSLAHALLAKTGACSTRDLAPLERSNKRKLHPVFTAMLGCAYERGKTIVYPCCLAKCPFFARVAVPWS